MDHQDRRDDALFEALKRRKRKRRRRIIRTVILTAVLLALAVAAGVRFLRRRVEESIAGAPAEISTAAVTVGNISTQVSGSGTLVNVDEEQLTVPPGVTIDEVIASANETIRAGQLLARVNSVSVLNTMEKLQNEMAELDRSIYSASADKVENYIASGVEGRVKIIYARTGDDVVKCMAEHGALAVLSLDGTMVARIEAPDLRPGTEVTVRRENGAKIQGMVESNISGIVSVLIPDDGPEADETVSVLSPDGREIGSGRLAIHSPLRISGTSGRISVCNIAENDRVYVGSSLFALSELSYYARYQTLLEDRVELEETLLELMKLYQDGGLTAPYDGSVSSVDYQESKVSAAFETAVFTVSPDKSMEITIDVDESNILVLEAGQHAQVTVSSIGEQTFPGVVTEISTEANSASGVTLYSAVVTVDKTQEMLPGMSARVVISIRGVEDALVIPLDALHRNSSSAYVYLGYDEEARLFTGMTPVTVGITSTSFAEITSGLKEGDVVYYTPSQGRTGFSGAFGQGRPSGRRG